MNDFDPIPILALDVPDATAALKLVDELGDECRFYKVGNELFTAAGPQVVRQIRERGCDVFLDLKFHDIPNTVAGGVRNAVSLGARLLTVHATGGRPMIEAAVRAAGGDCGILVVTVLTSMAATEVAAVWGRTGDLDLTREVERLAGIARDTGAHGVVCSGQEAGLVYSRYRDRLAILVPGVRATGAAVQDQSRVVTPRQAAAAGARYVVIGRMVTAATDRSAALAAVVAELKAGAA